MPFRHLINFAPLVVFFAAYYIAGSFHVATAALMLAVAVQIAMLKLLRLTVSPMEWTTAGLILFFGGVTLILRDIWYLQIKTTVINFIFAAVLLAADFVFKKNLLQALLSPFFDAPLALWRRVSVALAVTFALVGTANLIVITSASEETWVWIKTFVYPGVNFIAIIGIIAYLMQKATPKDVK